MSMQVSVVHCHRECKCHFCGEMITVGSPMAVGKYSKKHQGWFGTVRWHLLCWYEQSLVYLDQNPYVPSHKGRVPLSLSPEDSKLRLALLRRRASVLQRVNRMMDGQKATTYLSSTEIERLSHLSEMLEEIKTQIEPVGGVPKSWR